MTRSPLSSVSACYLQSFSSHTGSALGQDCGAGEPRTSVTENLLIRQRQGEGCEPGMLST